jgi:nitrogen fixation-related uncharacterized protein
MLPGYKYVWYEDEFQMNESILRDHQWEEEDERLKAGREEQSTNLCTAHQLL